VLELAGRLPPGSARGLNRAMGRAMFKGLQPGK